MSRILPFLFFLISLGIMAFGAGIFVAQYKIGPYRTIASGTKTLQHQIKSLWAPAYYGQFRAKPTDIALDQVVANRLVARPSAQTYGDKILVSGGLYEYMDLCPELGCIAVEMDRSGEVLHAFPYKLEAILNADTTGGSLYREAVPAELNAVMRPFGLDRYPNGDLLVVFQSTGVMFPFGAGAARIDRDGNPLWFRFDYSHHWPTILEDGTALVPDIEIRDSDLVIPLGPDGHTEELTCETGRPQVDRVHVLDGDGNVTKSFDLAAALLASPWAPILTSTTHDCDPLHINFVDMLDETTTGENLRPGLLVISMRNISSIVVFDPESEKVVDVIRGTFVEQHSVQQLEGSKVLLFDNWGGDAVGGASRLLEVDLVTGVERRIFPLQGTPEFEENPFSWRGGRVDISADRKRALVSFSGQARGYEVDIASGDMILKYNSLHDLSDVSVASDEHKKTAVQALLKDMLYFTE